MLDEPTRDSAIQSVVDELPDTDTVTVLPGLTVAGPLGATDWAAAAVETSVTINPMQVQIRVLIEPPPIRNTFC